MFKSKPNPALIQTLDEDSLLLLGLPPQTSIDALLEVVRHTMKSYALQLGLGPDSPWLNKM